MIHYIYYKLIDYFIAFPAVVSTEEEANQRNEISGIIDSFEMMHHGCQLGQAVSDNRHDKEKLPASGVVPQVFQRPARTVSCRVHDRHEE